MLRLPYRELPVENPGEPDRRSPFAYLRWLAWHQKWLLLGNATFGVGWMLCMALLWAAVGAGIDKGVAHHNPHALVTWGFVVLGLGMVQAFCGAMRHQLAVTNWMTATYRTIQLIGRRISTAGTALTDAIPSGDVVNTVAADAMRIGGAFDVFARFTGAVVSWLVVAFILLSTSLTLGLIVLLGVPVLASLTTPLMKPLHATQAAQREVAGRLAALGSDTVTGLRILRGIGGEDVFFNNYQTQSRRVRLAGNRVANPQAGLESGQILLPAILTTLVTFFGSHAVMNGTLQPGQLIAFFGYANFLTTPLRTAIEYVISTTRAYVGAGKVLRILNVIPHVSDPATPLPWPETVTEVRDEVTGVAVRAGEFVALVTETPAEATAVVDRLGRFVADDEGVSVNGRPIDQYALADVRRSIVVSEIEPRIFSGLLRGELDPHGQADDDQLRGALATASALDVLEGLEDGFDTWVEERGRSFSGGQRQRLSLVRALLAQADVLLLVEPTSAVDTHTEGRIATRLRAHRAGGSTLVATTSPLLLEKADRVIVVANGRVEVEGRHADLINTSATYRQIVLREDGE